MSDNHLKAPGPEWWMYPSPDFVQPFFTPDGKKQLAYYRRQGMRLSQPESVANGHKTPAIALAVYEVHFVSSDVPV